MKNAIVTLMLVGLSSLTLTAQNSGEPKVVEGKPLPVLQDIPIVGDLFKKQDEKEGSAPRTVVGRRLGSDSGMPPLVKGVPIIGLRSAAKARAEKRVGEPKQLTRDAEGHLPAPRVGFGQRWLRDRVLDVEGVQRVEIFERHDMSLESKGKGDSDGPRPEKLGSVVVAQRYFRIDAVDQAAIQRAMDVIDGHHAHDDGMVLFDVRIVTVAAHSLRDTVMVLGDDKTAVEGILAQGDVEVVSAPQVLVYGGQDAEISLMNRTAYIKDYSVEHVADAVIADPIVATVDHGLRLEMAAMHDPRSGVTHVGFGVRQSKLDLPIRVVRTGIDVAGKKQEVSIQLPELQFTRMATDRIELPKQGGEFLIAPKSNLLSEKNDKKLVFLVKVTRVPAETPDFDGTVRGYDATRRLAYVDFEGTLSEDQVVDFNREETYLGRGRVESITGRIALIVLDKAADIRVGDSIK